MRHLANDLLKKRAYDIYCGKMVVDPQNQENYEKILCLHKLKISNNTNIKYLLDPTVVPGCLKQLASNCNIVIRILTGQNFNEYIDNQHNFMKRFKEIKNDLKKYTREKNVNVDDEYVINNILSTYYPDNGHSIDINEWKNELGSLYEYISIFEYLKSLQKNFTNQVSVDIHGSYKHKYLKYKEKYLKLKNRL